MNEHYDPSPPALVLSHCTLLHPSVWCTQRMGVTGWLVLLQLGHELGESLVPLTAQVFPFQLHAETEECTEHTLSNSKQKHINLSQTCHWTNSV